MRAQGDKYIDKLRYKDLGQEKKKGFLTSDFSKKDEFSNTIRTNQWREQLKVGRASVGVCALGIQQQRWSHDAPSPNPLACAMLPHPTHARSCPT